MGEANAINAVTREELMSATGEIMDAGRQVLSATSGLSPTQGPSLTRRGDITADVDSIEEPCRRIAAGLKLFADANRTITTMGQGGLGSDTGAEAMRIRVQKASFEAKLEAISTYLETNLPGISGACGRGLGGNIGDSLAELRIPQVRNGRLALREEGRTP